MFACFRVSEFKFFIFAEGFRAHFMVVLVSTILSEFTITKIIVIALIRIPIFQTCELVITHSHHEQEYLNQKNYRDSRTTFHLSGFENTCLKFGM